MAAEEPIADSIISPMEKVTKMYIGKITAAKKAHIFQSVDLKNLRVRDVTKPFKKPQRASEK